MRFLPSLLLGSLAALLALPVCAQDMAPRAYVITPVDANVITLTWSYYNGGLNLNGAIPITGLKVNATGIYSVPTVTYYHALSFFGRSANIVASLPYGVGTFEGEIQGGAEQLHRSVYRSGLLDFTARFSVNLLGGPAMPAGKFATWKQKLLLGVSLKVIAPTGQYDPARVVNWGIHRWAFKPEFGYSERWGNWLLDAYAGAWFYTANSASFALPTPKLQTEAPIASFEGHLSRDFAHGTWISLDGNFWWGGVTTLGGIANPATRQTSSRIGVSAAWRFSNHQSLKASYSRGTYVRFGGNYQNLQVAWQYSWLGWPKIK
jgi:hypothetical protein